MHEFLAILFRWLHVATAAVAIGGAFFMRLLVPRGLAQLEPEQQKAVFLKLRRGFKMLIHTSILLLLVSGIYNTWGNWGIYNQIAEKAHPLWGTHVLLGLIIFGIALYVLIGKEPPAKYAKWMAVNLILMALTLAMAAALKYVRDNRPLPVRETPVALSHLE
jgi:uncharacterized membrane protein